MITIQVRRELYAQCFDELIRQTTVSATIIIIIIIIIIIMDIMVIIIIIIIISELEKELKDPQ